MKQALLAAAVLAALAGEASGQACAPCLPAAPTCGVLPPVCRPSIQIADRPPPAPPCNHPHFERPNIRLHPATHGQPCFKEAYPATSPRLVEFCPPAAQVKPFVPGCVHVMAVDYRPPTYCSLPPPPPVKLAPVIEQPPRSGPPFHKPGIYLLDRQLPYLRPVEPCPCPPVGCTSCPPLAHPMPR